MRIIVQRVTRKKVRATLKQNDYQGRLNRQLMLYVDNESRLIKF